MVRASQRRCLHRLAPLRVAFQDADDLDDSSTLVAGRPVRIPARGQTQIAKIVAGISGSQQ